MLTYNIRSWDNINGWPYPHIEYKDLRKLVRNFDIVLLQEVFEDHNKICQAINYPFHTKLQYSIPILGDGLTRYSKIKFYKEPVRYKWEECNGYLTSSSDCIANKGFTVTIHYPINNIPILVYNVHLDAGDSSLDKATRQQQLEQLAKNIAFREWHYSYKIPIIVAGDFNIKTDEKLIYLQFLEDTGLQDTCYILKDQCKEEEIDKVIYKSSYIIKLEPITYNKLEDINLSDHKPIYVDFIWEEEI